MRGSPEEVIFKLRLGGGAGQSLGAWGAWRNRKKAVSSGRGGELPPSPAGYFGSNRMRLEMLRRKMTESALHLELSLGLRAEALERGGSVHGRKADRKRFWGVRMGTLSRMSPGFPVRPTVGCG